jgi:acyl carrier protein
MEGKNMDNSKIIILIAEMLEIDSSKLTPETKLSELNQWDSMAKLSLIVLLSDNFGKKIDYTTIRGFLKLADIINFIKQ